ncbi:MAG: TetR/AcrR family transcriptional regulator [Paludibacteraceae bacterium]|nr:TetR/AcrR family transcriptional regulator [Paludibacteraceae bacterium]MBO5988112.1 TetR/AcrR family transcriptional regulator [Paludibacteraceae bacterium]
MMIAKTKDILVDVARKLFAEKGFENTTMNDIALASQKGRRTLYTYFKSKEDIYFAVVETELDQIKNRLDDVMQKDLRPDDKLVDFIYTHLDTIKDIVNRNGNLKADFFSNISVVEKVRRKLDLRERVMLKIILEKGIEEELFSVEDPYFAALMINNAVKGMEVPYIRGELEYQMKNKRKQITNFLFFGLKQK